MSKGYSKKRKVPGYPRSIGAFGQRFEPTTWYISIFMLGFVGYLLFTHRQYWSIAIPVVMFLISAWLSKQQLRHWQDNCPKTDQVKSSIEERAMASYGIQGDLTWGEYMRRKIMIAGLTEIPFHVQSRLRTLDRYRVSAFRTDLVEDYDFQEAKTTVELYLNLHRIETESNQAVNRFEGSMMPGQRPVNVGFGQMGGQPSQAGFMPNMQSDVTRLLGRTTFGEYYRQRIQSLSCEIPDEIKELLAYLDEHEMRLSFHSKRPSEKLASASERVRAFIDQHCSQPRVSLEPMFQNTVTHPQR